MKAGGNTLNKIAIPENIKNAFEHLRPVSEVEADQWAAVNNAIVEEGNEQQAGHLARLNDLVGPLSSGPASTLIWQKLSHPDISQKLIAADINLHPLPAERQIRMSSFNAVLELKDSQDFQFPDNNVFTTLHRDDFIWTIMRDAPPLKASLSAASEPRERLLFVPPDLFKNNKELRGAANVDTAILLRSVLEELGFYKNRALFISKIRVLTKSGTSTSDDIFFGFKVESLPSDEWMNLTDFSFASLLLTGRLSPQIAFRALTNLKKTAETLKRLGITMNSWAGLMVNVRTGEISLGEGDEPVLLDSALLSKALDRSLEDPHLYAVSDSLPYFPNLASISQGDQKLALAERQLIDIMIFLRRTSGRSAIQPTKQHLLTQIMYDFGLFLDVARDKHVLNSFSENKNTVEAAVEYYLDQFSIEIDRPDFKGILNFMTHILPGIMIISKPGEWFINALQYIDAAKKAHLDGERNLEAFWAKASESLWRQIKLAREDRTGGGGRGGSSTQTPGSNGSPGGPGGGHIAQASGTDVMHPPVGWVASSAQQLFVQALAPSAVPAASFAPIMQSGIMFFGVPPSTLIH